MSNAYGGIGFCKEEAKTSAQLLLHWDHGMSYGRQIKSFLWRHKFPLGCGGHVSKFPIQSLYVSLLSMGPLTYCSASDIGFFIGLWTDFIAFNCQIVEWALIFANPVFKNSGIYIIRTMISPHKIEPWGTPQVIVFLDDIIVVHKYCIAALYLTNTNRTTSVLCSRCQNKKNCRLIECLCMEKTNNNPYISSRQCAIRDAWLAMHEFGRGKRAKFGEWT